MVGGAQHEYSRRKRLSYHHALIGEGMLINSNTVITFNLRKLYDFLLAKSAAGEILMAPPFPYEPFPSNCLAAGPNMSLQLFSDRSLNTVTTPDP